MTLKARIKFSTPERGYFANDENEFSREYADGLSFRLRSREGKSLAESTSFHIDVERFSSADEAFEYARKLRGALRYLAVLQGRGFQLWDSEEQLDLRADQPDHPRWGQSAAGTLVLPVSDEVAGEFWEVFPFGGMGSAFNPGGFLETVRHFLGHGGGYGEGAEAAEFLASAALERSDRARFLLSFFALECLMPEKLQPAPVINAAQRIHDNLGTVLRGLGIDLADDHKKIIKGALERVQRRSTYAVMKEWASHPTHAEVPIQGLTLKKFVALCIVERHKLAHGDGVPEP